MKKIFITLCCMISGVAFASCPSGFVSITESSDYGLNIAMDGTCPSEYTSLGTAVACNTAVTTPVCVYIPTCSAGQYLDTSDTCVDCPTWTVGDTEIDSMSPENNVLGISSCYVASGTTGTDATGTWSLTSDCKYE